MYVFIQAHQSMSIFLEEDWVFYKGKSDCKVILFAAYGQQSPGELSGGKVPNIFEFLMTLRWLNGL